MRIKGSEKKSCTETNVLKIGLKQTFPTVFHSGIFTEGFLPEAHIRNLLLHFLHDIVGKKGSLVILTVQNTPQTSAFLNSCGGVGGDWALSPF